MWCLGVLVIENSRKFDFVADDQACGIGLLDVYTTGNVCVALWRLELQPSIQRVPSAPILRCVGW